MRGWSAVLLAMVMAALIGGCGGGDRPSVAEISRALRAGGEDSFVPASVKLNEEAADCIAEKLEKSGVSDDGLRALVESDLDYVQSEAEKAEVGKLNGVLLACVTASLG